MPIDHSLRVITKELLDHRLSRRRFIRVLVSAGVVTSAARSMAASLDAQSPSSRSGEVIEASGGELMVRSLKSAGVKYIFGLPGTDEVGFVDALVDHPEIQYLLCVHEGPLAAMADGYAKVSGQPAFVNVHTVAGTSNVLGQLVNSSLDGTPIIFTAGNQDSRLRGHGSFLESPHLDSLPHNYTKWGWDVLRADMIPEVMRRAFKVATTPPGGPVFLTFSKDLWKQPKVLAEILPQERFTLPGKLGADFQLINQAALRLVQAKNPLLLAGDEISKYGGRPLLVELAELLAAPVVGELITGHGRINFPTLHPQYLGLFSGQKQLPLEFDVLLNAGGRMFSEFDFDPAPIVSREIYTIHMSVDTTNLARVYPVDVAIVADPETGLTALVERVKAILPSARRAENTRRLAVLSKIRSAQDANRKRRLEKDWAGRPISPARLAAELNEVIHRNAIVVTETVTSDIFNSDYLDYNNGDPGRTHLASQGGVLGWGIGAACGAKLAAPDREVVLLSGDGSFHFGVQGLWSAARYEIPVLFVIFNNSNYQSNRLGLIKYGGRAVETGKYIGTYLGDPEINHIQVARGYGVDGERVSEPGELKSALQRAVKAVREGKPYVLDVVIKRRFKGAEVSWHEKFSVAKMGQRPR